MQQDEGGQGLAARIPAPWIPPSLPRFVLAARAKALDTQLEELQAEGADPKKVEKVTRRRDRVKKEAKSAGGLTQQQLKFQLLDEGRNVAKFEASMGQAQQRIVDAQVAVDEAPKQKLEAEMDYEATKQKLANAHARSAQLAATLASETNADKHGGLHDTVSSIRQAVHASLPSEVQVLWQRLEELVRAVAPTLPSGVGGDPLLEPFTDSELASLAPTSVVDVDDDLAGRVGDLIEQSDLATAEADLQDLLKQQAAALALAIRTNESQEQQSQTIRW